MTLVLILFGAVLVSLALFNKVPRYVPPGRAQPVRRAGAPRTGPAARGRAAPRAGASARGGTATRGRSAAAGVLTGLRIELAPARLTEQGRALCTALGGSALIVAFFLTLSDF